MVNKKKTSHSIKAIIPHVATLLAIILLLTLFINFEILSVAPRFVNLTLLGVSLFVTGGLYGLFLSRKSNSVGLSRLQVWTLAAVIIPAVGLFLFVAFTFSL